MFSKGQCIREAKNFFEKMRDKALPFLTLQGTEQLAHGKGHSEGLTATEDSYRAVKKFTRKGLWVPPLRQNYLVAQSLASTQTT